MTPTPDDLRRTVREKYAAVARGEALSCCGPDDACGEINMIGDAYDGVEGYVPDADLKLGCGLPVEHAGLREGQTVLDLGAGAGLDAFVARRIVGDAGRVLGVDFTPEMVQKARANASALGYANVEFEHGDIEALPFADASVDVVVSNCVLNLVPGKARAFAEMRRVLRAGGHFCISDVVSEGEMAPSLLNAAELYAGCVSGAMPRAAYLDGLRAAGFAEVRVVAEREIALPAELLAGLPADALAAAGRLLSVTVTGVAADVPAPAMLRVYDPAMCCSTGLCGPDPDAALVQFAADLDALAAHGVAVERFNLAQQPEAFVAEPLVRDRIGAAGIDVLPMLLVGGRVVSEGRYPDRDALIALAGASAASSEPALDGLALDVAAAPCCGPATVSTCC
jgi:SAM-dependent methyltransferase